VPGTNDDRPWWIFVVVFVATVAVLVIGWLIVVLPRILTPVD
jgi:hypothetical protein